MDPNSTLEELRRLKDKWLHDEDPIGAVNDASRALELFEALDNWLSNGGFLPKDWERK